MKTHSWIHRSAFIGTLLTCLLFLGNYAVGQPEHVYRTPIVVQQGGDSARLIIRRIPNLGNNIVVDVYLDGQPFGVIGYGQTYDGPLPAGRHIISVLATPNPRWPDQPGLILDVRRGGTYAFMAMSNRSGNLILRPID